MTKIECLKKLNQGGELEVRYNKIGEIKKVSIFNENDVFLGAIQTRTYFAIKHLLKKGVTVQSSKNHNLRSEFYSAS